MVKEMAENLEFSENLQLIVPIRNFNRINKIDYEMALLGRPIGSLV
jgi:hypothetical protein